MNMGTCFPELSPPPHAVLAAGKHELRHAQRGQARIGRAEFGVPPQLCVRSPEMGHGFRRTPPSHGAFAWPAWASRAALVADHGSYPEIPKEKPAAKKHGQKADLFGTTLTVDVSLRVLEQAVCLLDHNSSIPNLPREVRFDFALLLLASLPFHGAGYF
jgi:hypothetical protein